MITKVIFISLFLCGVVDCSIEFFREFLEPDIFSAHGFHLSTTTLAEIKTEAIEVDDKVDAATYFCGPLSDLRKKMDQVSKLSSPIKSDQSQVVYLKKSKQRACFVSHISVANKLVLKNELGSLWTIEYLPEVLKIHSSVLQYLSFTARKLSPLNDSEFISKHKRRRSKTDTLRNKATLSPEEEISVAGNVLQIQLLVVMFGVLNVTCVVGYQYLCFCLVQRSMMYLKVCCMNVLTSEILSMR